MGSSVLVFVADVDGWFVICGDMLVGFVDGVPVVTVGNEVEGSPELGTRVELSTVGNDVGGWTTGCSEGNCVGTGKGWAGIPKFKHSFGMFDAWQKTYTGPGHSRSSVLSTSH